MTADNDKTVLRDAQDAPGPATEDAGPEKVVLWGLRRAVARQRALEGAGQTTQVAPERTAPPAAAPVEAAPPVAVAKPTKVASVAPQVTPVEAAPAAPKPKPVEDDDKTVFRIETDAPDDPAPRPEDDDRTVFTVDHTILPIRNGAEPVPQSGGGGAPLERERAPEAAPAPPPRALPHRSAQRAPRQEEAATLNLVPRLGDGAGRFDAPILQAAAPFLLRFARSRSGRLRLAPADLREALAVDLAQMDGLSAATEMDADDIALARYMLAASADLAMPPGRGEDSLVVRAFGEVDRGDGLLVCVDHALAQTPPSRDLLRLGLVALDLAGPHAVGAADHEARLRAALAERDARDDLSPAWAPSEQPARARRGARAHWALLAVPPLLLGVGLVAVAWWQSSASAEIRSDLRTMVPAQAAETLRIGRPTEIPAGIVPPVEGGSEEATPDGDTRLLAEAGRVLAPFLEDGRVELDRTADHARIRFAPALSFSSGSGARLPEIEEISAALAPVLASTSVPIQIVGHTDDVPPSGRAAFATNLALSEARAQAVADALAVHLPSRERLVVVGRGDTEPRASNATIEGRESNRRVEILIPLEPRP